MAAQEYYNPGSTSSRPHGPYDGGAPLYPPRPPRSNSVPSPSESLGPPPPYSFQAQYPQQQPQHQPQAQHYQQPPPPQPQYQPDVKQQQGQYYGQPQAHYQYPPQQPYYPSQPYNGVPYGPSPAQQYQQPRPAETGSLRPNAYSAEPAPYKRTHSQPPRTNGQQYNSSSRSRSGSRHRHHHHHSSSSSNKGKKGNVDTFVGAGGGAIIGDLIFPGLGTVGGALLGGLGGHKVAEEKRRRQSDAERRSRSTGHYGDDDRRGRY